MTAGIETPDMPTLMRRTLLALPEMMARDSGFALTRAPE
jgi:hypothetical protein